MRKTVYAGLAVLAVACGVGAASIVEAALNPKPDLKTDEPNGRTAEPMLKINVGGGHGSGFHVGGGYVFTAAHVVKGSTEVEVEAADGAKDTAEVLWINEKRDVALIKTKALRTKAAALSCTVPDPGSQVEARGNPNNLTFVSTWGQVAGKPLSLSGLGRPWFRSA